MGTGTLNIIDWCRENGNPRPVWSVRAGSVVLTFKPLSDKVAWEFGAGVESGQESQPESLPESLCSRIIEIIKEGPLSRSEISKKLGQKKISGQLNKVLKELLAEKVIGYTIPDKPQSRLQKYKLIKKEKK